MAKEHLFEDFPDFSEKEWKLKIETDLKGKPYESLKSVNGSGVTIEPVNTSQDQNKSDESPGSGSYKRSSKTNDNEWVIDEVFQISIDSKKDNGKVLELLNSGLTSLTFSGNVKKEILNGILPEYVTLGFSNYASLLNLIEKIKETFGTEVNKYKIHFNYDPIGEASLNGVWDQSTAMKLGVESVKQIQPYSSSRVFSVGGNNYHNAGGNAISELAFTLAHAHEYLMVLLESGYTIDDASAQIKIDLSSGGDYFLEIAKIRAFRMLWANLINAYTPAHSCSKTALIQSHTSQYLSTVYDPYVNMLRGTTQAMSAILGGCDILRVLPYNTAWTSGNDFSKRIARNIHLMLKEESYFDKVIDPAGGSYYIENLTNEIGRKAWEKFKKIEKKGGFIGLMESGNLDRELKEDAQLQEDKLDSQELKVLGVSLYPNPEDRMLDKLDEIDPTDSIHEKEFEPIELIRLVGKLEKQRLETEIEGVKA